jgi:hypothetical protein
MTENEKRMTEALERIGALCDFRPVATTEEQLAHLLAAIDATAAMALRQINAVALAS